MLNAGSRVQCFIFYTYWLQNLFSTFLKKSTEKKTILFIFFSAVSKAWATYLREFNSTVAESVCHNFLPISEFSCKAYQTFTLNSAVIKSDNEIKALEKLLGWI